MLHRAQKHLERLLTDLVEWRRDRRNAGVRELGGRDAVEADERDFGGYLDLLVEKKAKDSHRNRVAERDNGGGLTVDRGPQTARSVVAARRIQGRCNHQIRIRVEAMPVGLPAEIAVPLPDGH